VSLSREGSSDRLAAFCSRRTARDADTRSVATELTRVPCRLASEWTARTYTTRPQPGMSIDYDVWQLGVDVASEEPFRVVTLVYSPREMSWGMGASPPADRMTVPVSFRPVSWATSDAVQITFGWRRTAVNDSDLKADARDVVSVTHPASALTGTVEPVCEIARHGIEVAVLVAAERDIQRRRRHRWRVRPELARCLPPSLAVLADGRQAGIAQR